MIQLDDGVGVISLIANFTEIILNLAKVNRKYKRKNYTISKLWWMASSDMHRSKLRTLRKLYHQREQDNNLRI